MFSGCIGVITQCAGSMFKNVEQEYWYRRRLNSAGLKISISLVVHINMSCLRAAWFRKKMIPIPIALITDTSNISTFDF